MKNHLHIDNPLKIRPTAAAKRPALHTHAGKGFRRLMRHSIKALPEK